MTQAKPPAKPQGPAKPPAKPQVPAGTFIKPNQVAGGAAKPTPAAKPVPELPFHTYQEPTPLNSKTTGNMPFMRMSQLMQIKRDHSLDWYQGQRLIMTDLERTPQYKSLPQEAQIKVFNYLANKWSPRPHTGDFRGDISQYMDEIRRGAGVKTADAHAYASRYFATPNKSIPYEWLRRITLLPVSERLSAIQRSNLSPLGQYTILRLATHMNPLGEIGKTFPEAESYNHRVMRTMLMPAIQRSFNEVFGYPQMIMEQIAQRSGHKRIAKGLKNFEPLNMLSDISGITKSVAMLAHVSPFGHISKNNPTYKAWKSANFMKKMAIAGHINWTDLAASPKTLKLIDQAGGAGSYANWGLNTVLGFGLDPLFLASMGAGAINGMLSDSVLEDAMSKEVVSAEAAQTPEELANAVKPGEIDPVQESKVGTAEELNSEEAKATNEAIPEDKKPNIFKRQYGVKIDPKSNMGQRLASMGVGGSRAFLQAVKPVFSVQMANGALESAAGLYGNDMDPKSVANMLIASVFFGMDMAHGSEPVPKGATAPPVEEEQAPQATLSAHVAASKDGDVLHPDAVLGKHIDATEPKKAVIDAVAKTHLKGTNAEDIAAKVNLKPEDVEQILKEGVKDGIFHAGKETDGKIPYRAVNRAYAMAVSIRELFMNGPKDGMTATTKDVVDALGLKDNPANNGFVDHIKKLLIDQGELRVGPDAKIQWSGHASNPAVAVPTDPNAPQQGATAVDPQEDPVAKKAAIIKEYIDNGVAEQQRRNNHIPTTDDEKTADRKAITDYVDRKMALEKDMTPEEITKAQQDIEDILKGKSTPVTPAPVTPSGTFDERAKVFADTHEELRKLIIRREARGITPDELQSIDVKIKDLGEKRKALLKSMTPDEREQVTTPYKIASAKRIEDYVNADAAENERKRLANPKTESERTVDKKATQSHLAEQKARESDMTASELKRAKDLARKQHVARLTELEKIEKDRKENERRDNVKQKLAQYQDTTKDLPFETPYTDKYIQHLSSVTKAWDAGKNASLSSEDQHVTQELSIASKYKKALAAPAEIEALDKSNPSDSIKETYIQQKRDAIKAGIRQTQDLLKIYGKGEPEYDNALKMREAMQDVLKRFNNEYPDPDNPVKGPKQRRTNSELQEMEAAIKQAQSEGYITSYTGKGQPSAEIRAKVELGKKRVQEILNANKASQSAMPFDDETQTRISDAFNATNTQGAGNQVLNVLNDAAESSIQQTGVKPSPNNGGDNSPVLSLIPGIASRGGDIADWFKQAAHTIMHHVITGGSFFIQQGAIAGHMVAGITGHIHADAVKSLAAGLLFSKNLFTYDAFTHMVSKVPYMAAALHAMAGVPALPDPRDLGNAYENKNNGNEGDGGKTGESLVNYEEINKGKNWRETVADAIKENRDDEGYTKKRRALNAKRMKQIADNPGQFLDVAKNTGKTRDGQIPLEQTPFDVIKGNVSSSTVNVAGDRIEPNTPVTKPKEEKNPSILNHLRRAYDDTVKKSTGGLFRRTRALSVDASNEMHRFVSAVTYSVLESEHLINSITDGLSPMEKHAMWAHAAYQRMADAIVNKGEPLPVMRLLKTLYPHADESDKHLSMMTRKILSENIEQLTRSRDKAVADYNSKIRLDPVNADKVPLPDRRLKVDNIQTLEKLFHDRIKDYWGNPDDTQDPKLKASRQKILDAWNRYAGKQMDNGHAVLDPESPLGRITVKRMTSADSQDWQKGGRFVPMVAANAVHPKDPMPWDSLTAQHTKGAAEITFSGFRRYETDFDKIFAYAHVEAARAAALHVLYHNLSKITVDHPQAGSGELAPTPLVMEQGKEAKQMPGPVGYMPIETRRERAIGGGYKPDVHFVHPEVAKDLKMLSSGRAIDDALSVLRPLQRLQIGVNFTAPSGFARHFIRIAGWLGRMPVTVYAGMAERNAANLALVNTDAPYEDQVAQSFKIARQDVEKSLETTFDNVSNLFKKTATGVPRILLRKGRVETEIAETADPLTDATSTNPDKPGARWINKSHWDSITKRALDEMFKPGSEHRNAKRFLDLVQALPVKDQTKLMADYTTAMRDHATRNAGLLLHDEIKNGWMQKVGKVGKLGNIPWLGPRLAGLLNVSSVDMNSPANIEIAKMLVGNNSLKTNPFDEMWTAGNKITHFGHDLLFSHADGKGVRGIDMRSRVMAARVYMAATGDLNPENIRNFVNSIGQYTMHPDNPIHFMSNINPFIRTTGPFFVHEMKALFGSAGMDMSKATPGEKALAGLHVMRNGWVGSAIALSLLNYSISGHWPWQNKPGHLFDIEPSPNRFVPLAWFAEPGEMRALDAMGVPQGISSVAHKKSVLGALQGPAQVAAQVFTPPILYPLMRSAVVSKYGDPNQLISEQMIGQLSPYVGAAIQLYGAEKNAYSFTDKAWGYVNAASGLTTGLQSHKTKVRVSNADPIKEMRREMDAASRIPKP